MYDMLAPVMMDLRDRWDECAYENRWGSSRPFVTNQTKLYHYQFDINTNPNDGKSAYQILYENERYSKILKLRLGEAAQDFKKICEEVSALGARDFSTRDDLRTKILKFLGVERTCLQISERQREMGIKNSIRKKLNLSPVSQRKSIYKSNKGPAQPEATWDPNLDTMCKRAIGNYPESMQRCQEIVLTR
jgi:hypothetical protein